MDKKKTTVLTVLLLVLCALLSACGSLGGPAETTRAEATVRPPDGDTPGKYKWPADLLPAGLPALCAEVEVITSAADGSLVVAAKEPSWHEMKAFVEALIADGWGSYAAGVTALFRKSSSGDGMTEERIFSTALSMAKRFSDAADENESTMTYLGQKDGKQILCRLEPKEGAPERESETRFTMWIADGTDAAAQAFPSPGCTVRIWNGWTAQVQDGQLYVKYDFDASGMCLWSLSSGTGGTPAERMEEYFTMLTANAELREKAEETLTVAGGTEVCAASFTATGTVADVWCLYAAWKTADGRIWQLTVTANDYDAPAARAAVTAMLSDFSPAGDL